MCGTWRGEVGGDIEAGRQLNKKKLRGYHFFTSKLTCNKRFEVNFDSCTGQKSEYPNTNSPVLIISRKPRS